MLSLSSHLMSSRRLPQLLVINMLRCGANIRRSIQNKSLERIQKSIDERFNRIDLNARRTGRVTRREVDEIFKEISVLTKSTPATSSQSLLLIRCCGSLMSEEPPAARNVLARQVIDMLSSTSKLDVSHYNSLLQVYLDNGFNFDPLEILKEIESKGIEPNRVTFQRLIHRFCLLGDIEGATKILEFMKSKQLAINESVFNSLILGYGKANDLQSAYNTLEIMKGSGLEPSADTYTSLICAFASAAKDPEALKRIPELINEAHSNEIILNDRDIMEVIKTLAVADSDCELIDELIAKIPKAIGYNQECIKVVGELIHLNQIDVALKLYETMKPSQSQLQQKNIGVGLIRHLVRAKVPTDVVLNVCNDLKNKGFNDMGINRAAEIALTIGDVKAARVYLEKLSQEAPLRVHYFWPLLARSRNETEVFEILSEDMVSLASADYGSLHTTFTDYVWPKEILDVDLFMEKCKTIGFSYTLTLNSLVDYLFRNNRIAEGVKILSMPKYLTTRLQSRILVQTLAETYIEKPDVENVIKVLQELAKSPERNSFDTETNFNDWTGRFILHIIGMRANDTQRLLSPLLEAINSAGLRISSGVTNAIRDRVQLNEHDSELLAKISSDEFDSVQYYDPEDISKPRNQMTSEELEEHLIELKSKGLNTRGVLRSLLMAYCRRTRFSPQETRSDLVVAAQNRVKEIMEQMNKEGYEFSNAMHAAVMEFHINCEDIEKAEEAKSKISADFGIDPHKIFNLASLYVKQGKIEEAIKLIEKEKESRAKSVAKEDEEPEEGEGESGKSTYRKSDRSINRLLNNIIEQTKDAKIVKQVFNLASNYSGMTVTTLMAGPLVKVHLINENYAAALAEYVECATTHRVAPWKTELMRVFLEKSDSASLQTVIDHSNELYGEMNTLIDLASACVDVGKIKQAKKILETPGLRVKQEKLELICNKYISDGKIDELDQFIQVTKNLFDINRDQMFYNLIKGYAKINAAQKALNVWTLMQEENIQPSERTLRLLAGVLEQHNITPPFEVPAPPSTPAVSTAKKSSERSAETLDKSSHNQLNVAINRGDIDKALEIKQNLEAKGESILLSQHCSIIEALLNADRVKQACNLTQSLLQSGRYPAPRILRYLLSKLASSGDLVMINDLQPKLPNTVVQTAWYTSILANAYVSAGKADEFIDKVLPDLKPFPLGGLLALLGARADLEGRVLAIANQMAEETDYHLPQNMVWLHLMQNERYDDAKRIFDSNPKFKEFLLFTALLDKIRETKNITMGRKLIETLLSTNLTAKSVGIGYSALIEVLVENNEIDEAESIVVDELVSNKVLRTDSKTGEQVKIVDIEHINRSSLLRLINAIREKKQREPKFTMPRKALSVNSSNDDSGSSSDEEAVGVKQK